MLKKIIGFVIVCILLVSCKKEQSQTNTANNRVTPPSVVNYYGLSVGSYWVYDTYLVDTLNNSSYQNEDSVWIRADTIIRGNTYYIMAGPNFDLPPNPPLRDSSGWLVNDTGLKMCNNLGDTSIFFTRVDTGTCTITMAMQPATFSISVPAGTFSCIDALGTYRFTVAYSHWGNPRYLYNYYTNGVGLVFQTDFYTVSPNHLERRLVRYHVN